MRWGRKRVLVTGGTSFIGRHLIDNLIELGAQLKISTRSKTEKINLANRDFETYRGDLMDKEFVRKLMRDADIIFHLAAFSGGRRYLDAHPADCIKNIAMDNIVFDEAKNNSSNVVYVSSVLVYDPRYGSIPLKEEFVDWKNMKPADGAYGLAKLIGEYSLQCFHQQYGLRSVSCRLSNLYGEGQDETHAVIALIAKAFKRMDPYPIWGDGTQARNFTYVKDAVECIKKAAVMIDDASPINIGTMETVTIDRMAEMIFEITGFKPRKIKYEKNKSLGVHTRIIDNTRAEQLLGFNKWTTLYDGLKRTIEWYYDSHRKNKRTFKINKDLLCT